MAHKELEKKEGSRKVETVPKGINVLMVAPRRLFQKIGEGTLGHVHALMCSKITGETIRALDIWDGSSVNADSHAPYDGIIVICDILSEVRERIVKVSRERSIPVLIISSLEDNRDIDTVRLFSKLQHIEHGMTQGPTVNSILKPSEVDDERISKFIAQAAYRKLVPRGLLTI